MKNKACFALLCVLVIASSAFGAGSVSLTLNGAKAPASFNSGDIKSLTATITLPKPLKAFMAGNDQVDVFMTLSHLDVKGVIFYNIADVPENWANSNKITVDLLTDFKDAYGGSYGLADFTSNPASAKKASITCNVQMKVFKKTGEKSNTYWDKAYETWKTETVPVFNAGTVIAQSPKYTLAVGKLTAATNSKGSIVMDFPDDSWGGKAISLSGGQGNRNQFDAVRVYRLKDTKIPFDVYVDAFTIDPSLFTGYPDLRASIKDDLVQEYTDVPSDQKKPLDQRLGIGWSYFLGGGSGKGDAAYFKNAGGLDYDASKYKVEFTPATVAGASGEKAELPLAQGNRPFYLANVGSKIVAAFAYYDSSYYDENSGKMQDVSDELRGQINGYADSIISKMKVQ